MQLRRKILITVGLVALVGAVVGFGTFSAFSSTATNSGNTFAAGTVYLTDNDAGSAMYNVSAAAPSQSSSYCIKLTYGGTLPATVKLYTTSTLGSVANYVDLTIERGTVSGSPAFPSCTGFTAGSTIYSGTLGNFASTKNSYANGVSAFPGSQTQWNQNDTLVYRFTLSLQSDPNANGGATPLSTGSHAFTWEAQNQ